MFSSISADHAWELIDMLSPEALCASLPSAVDQSRGFKLSYLGTEPIVSPIVFCLPIAGTSDHAHFLVESCQFFDELMDYEQIFSDLTSQLDSLALV